MIHQDISIAADVLRTGGLIGFPTETVYGLAANALNEFAIDKIYKLKNRPSSNPLIVHTHSLEEVTKYVTHIPPSAFKLAKTFWPGSLTLLLPKNKLISHAVTAGSHLVAIRIPQHPLALNLLRSIDFPLVAPSANPYTRISPTSAQMVEAYFGEDLPCILDGGHCEKGIESTIVGFDGNTTIVYRQGAISIDAIEFIVGKTKVLATVRERVTTPGMAPMHYAPRTKFVIVEDVLEFINDNPFSKIGFLGMGEKKIEHPNLEFVSLSITNDLEEASMNLYQSMYTMDTLNLDYIVVKKFPETGIGNSLNDRITRASYEPQLQVI
jgi:L-threonylcarbamoyladenylate synthase